MDDYQRHLSADRAEQNAAELKTKLVIAEYLERKNNEIKRTRAELKATHDWDYTKGICRACGISEIEWESERIRKDGCKGIC